jgi:hypothetical protein
MSSKTKSSQNGKVRKPLAKPAFNISHPDLADKIEFAFQVGAHKFYRFVEEYQMPTGRYKWVMSFLREVDLRMDLDKMKAFMAELRRCLSGKKGEIDLITAGRIIYNIEAHLELAFEPETIKRLASVVYFDDTEDLSDFDQKKGEWKRNLWSKYNTLGFFLTKPIGELLGLKNTSPESLQDYINQTTEILKELILPLQPSQPESTSENGKKT